MAKYITKSGDMWDYIAEEEMGSSRYTPELMNANRDKLEYFIFPEGVELVIPNVPAEVDKTVLPPWY